MLCESEATGTVPIYTYYHLYFLILDMLVQGSVFGCISWAGTVGGFVIGVWLLCKLSAVSLVVDSWDKTNLWFIFSHTMTCSCREVFFQTLCGQLSFLLTDVSDVTTLGQPTLPLSHKVYNPLSTEVMTLPLLCTRRWLIQLAVTLLGEHL